MMDDFHHGGQVTLFLKFARIDIDQGKQFIGIDQVEIAGQCEVPGGNGISFDKGMTEFDIVLSLCAISQMTQQEFTQIRRYVLSSARDVS